MKGVEKMQKKYCLSFQTEFYKKLQRQAKKRGTTVAAYIKEAIMQKMEREGK